MKKILLIKGYGRKGTVANIAENVLKEFENEFEISEFDTYKTPFAFCNGCNHCEKEGECVHRDLDVFFGELENADVVIFASPVYNGGFSAPLKALIDRFQPYYTWFYNHSKTPKTKKHRLGIILAASGGGGQDAMTYMENQLKFAFSVMNMSLYSSVLCPFTDTEPRSEQAKKELREILENLSRS